MSAPATDHAPPIGILSVGVYIPRTFITAAEIAERSGVPEEVIIHKMGIVRKPVAGPADHTNAMGLWAAEDALERAGVDPDEIDLVLCTTEEWKEYPLWTAGSQARVRPRARGGPGRSTSRCAAPPRWRCSRWRRR